MRRRVRGRPWKLLRGGRGRPRTLRAETRPAERRATKHRSSQKPRVDNAETVLEERRRDIEVKDQNIKWQYLWKHRVLYILLISLNWCFMFKRRVDVLSHTEMRNTLIRLVYENPEYLFNILGTPEVPQRPEGPGSSQSSWCVFTFCKDMPTQREGVCCKKRPDSCISRLPVSSLLIKY